MSTLTRADTPTQSPCGELYWLGVSASVDGVDLGQQALVLQVLERRRVLGVDDVGRRVRPLGHDLVGQGVLVVVADVDGDPGGLLEAGDQGVGGLLVLAVVERDRLARSRARPAGGEQARRLPPAPPPPSGPLVRLVGSRSPSCLDLGYPNL